MSEVKQKFDGYAAKYDEWFMKNENLFISELRLFKKVLGDITGKKLLSVGCGSGLFESYIDSSNIEGIEPSEDMAKIAEKRGINVIKYGLIEDVDLPDAEYDIIYFNGSRVVARSSGPHASRGVGGVTWLIFDEAAFIEKGDVVYSSAIPTVSTGGHIIMISTPNGKDALYYKTCKLASQKGSSTWNNFELVKLKCRFISANSYSSEQ